MEQAHLTSTLVLRHGTILCVGWSSTTRAVAVIGPIRATSIYIACVFELRSSLWCFCVSAVPYLCAGLPGRQGLPLRARHVLAAIAARVCALR